MRSIRVYPACTEKLQGSDSGPGLSSIEQSPELRDLGKLIIYRKILGLSNIKRSSELLRDPEKLIIYCKMHGLSSIERAPLRTGKVSNIL